MFTFSPEKATKEVENSLNKTIQKQFRYFLSMKLHNKLNFAYLNFMGQMLQQILEFSRECISICNPGQWSQA